MSDDLGKLPGDDDVEPKRKGLRRLRKAERALQKQEQARREKQQSLDTTTGGGGGGGKGGGKGKSNSTTPPPQPADDDSGATGEESLAGRQWQRRRWKASGLTELAQVLLSAGEAASSAGRGATPDVTKCDTPKTIDVNNAKGTEDGSRKASTAGSNEPASGRRGTNKAAGAGKGGKKKGTGKGNVKEAGAADEGKEPEAEEVVIARREREELEANVRAWVEGFREDLEGETFVTTAHRGAVVTRDKIVSELTGRTKVRMTGRSGALS